MQLCAVHVCLLSRPMEFPCLSVGLRTNPDRACQYVIACVVLHNIGIQRQDIVTLSLDDLTIAGPDVQEINHANKNGFGYRDVIAIDNVLISEQLIIITVLLKFYFSIQYFKYIYNNKIQVYQINK